jgi:hypothetical protein
VRVPDEDVAHHKGKAAGLVEVRMTAVTHEALFCRHVVLEAISLQGALYCGEVVLDVRNNAIAFAPRATVLTRSRRFGNKFPPWKLGARDAGYREPRH